MGESAYFAYSTRDSPFDPRAKVQGREGGEREARTHKEVNVEGKDKNSLLPAAEGFLRERGRNEMRSSYLCSSCKG